MTLTYPNKLNVGNFVVDIKYQTIEDKEFNKVPVSALTFSLLETLINQAPNIVSSDEIIKNVWSKNHVSDETLQQRVRLLRKCLQDDPSQPQYIVNVRNKGYKLIAPITEYKKKSQLSNASDGSSLTIWKGLALAFFVISMFFAWQHYSIQNSQIKTQNTISQKEINRRLAVLPLTAIQPDIQSQTFANGLSDQLVMALSYIQEIHLIDKATMNYYSKMNTPLAEIGKELSLGSLITGEVSRSKDRIFIKIGMFNVNSGNLIWSKEFDTEFTQIFQVQTQIAKAIADELKIQLNPMAEKIISTPTKSTSAYDYILQARKYHSHLQKEDNDIAIELSLKAIELDPKYTSAYIELGFGYLFKNGHWQASTSYIDKAIEQAKIAIELSPDNFIAHYLLGLSYQYKSDNFPVEWLKMARSAYQKAIELNPNSAFVKVSLASISDDVKISTSLELNYEVLSKNPKSELTHLRIATIFESLNYNDIAIKWYEKAIEIKPDYYRSMTALSHLHLSLGHYDTALKYTNKYLQRYPKRSDELFQKAKIYYFMGRLQEAQEAYHIADKSLAQEYRLNNGYYITSYIYLADIYKRLGNTKDYEDLLQRVKESAQTVLNDFPESNWQMTNQSLIFALQEDQDKAFKWLQKAETFGFNSDDWLKVNPLYESLNSSGRLQPIYDSISKKISQERAQVKQLGLLKDDITF